MSPWRPRSWAGKELKLDREGGAVQSELLQLPDGVTRCFGARRGLDQLRILEEVVNQPVAARDRAVDASFEVLWEPPLPETAEQLTRGEALELCNLLAKGLAIDELLSRPGRKQQLRQFEPQVALERRGRHNYLAEGGQEGNRCLVKIGKVGGDRRSSVAGFLALRHWIDSSHSASGSGRDLIDWELGVA